ncbi:MAG TPA: CARDB domain-containing protein, partial [Bacteroidia bacterium]
SNAVSETNENNNVSSIPITVTVPSIDLVVQTPALSTSSVVVGNSVSGSCYIYNQGNTLAPSSNVGFYLSTDAIWDAGDVFLTSVAGSSLAGSTSSYRGASLNIPSGTTPGSYYILYFADYSNVVSEVNENNNVSALPFTVVAGYVDFVIQTPTITPTTIYAGGNIASSCYIYNQGTSAATSSNIGYYLSTDNVWDSGDTFLNSTSGSTLSSTTSSLRNIGLTIPATTPVGSYYIIFFADYSNAVTESIETNNYAVIPITVTPFTNIITMPISGSSTYTVCSASIYDDGGSIGNYSNGVNSTTTLYPASSGNKIRLVFNSLVVETCCDFLQIYDGTSTSATLLGTYTSNPGTITASNASGALTLHFSSDVSVSYAGFDASITCVSSGTLADLAPISLSCNPNPVPLAGTASVTCQVLNSGNSTAGSSILGIYLSADTIKDASDILLGSDTVASINPSASAFIHSSVTVPLSTPLGNYFLLFLADTANSVAENNKTNNLNWIPVTVSQTVGVQSISSSEYISVYPNPSSGDVYFSISSSSKKADIQIFDCIGRKMEDFTIDIGPARQFIATHHFNTKGMFIAEIRTDGALFYRRIIVQ